MATYATGAELATFLGQTDPPTDAERLLLRASERLDYHTLGRSTLAMSRGAAADLEALSNAACAQVEFWVKEVGEEHDIAEPKGWVMIGNVRYEPQGPLAPRARNFLMLRALLNRGVAMR